MAFLSNIRSTALAPRRRRFALRDLVALAHQRRALRRLDAAAREDLGLSPEEIDRESRRVFWDVPEHWRN
ncbi:MAG: hypothetical protein RIG84_20270 [Roseovarius sp.]